MTEKFIELREQLSLALVDRIDLGWTAHKIVGWQTRRLLKIERVHPGFMAWVARNSIA